MAPRQRAAQALQSKPYRFQSNGCVWCERASEHLTQRGRAIGLARKRGAVHVAHRPAPPARSRRDCRLAHGAELRVGAQPLLRAARVEGVPAGQVRERVALGKVLQADGACPASAGIGHTHTSTQAFCEAPRPKGLSVAQTSRWSLPPAWPSHQPHAPVQEEPRVERPRLAACVARRPRRLEGAGGPGPIRGAWQRVQHRLRRRHLYVLQLSQPALT